VERPGAGATTAPEASTTTLRALSTIPWSDAVGDVDGLVVDPSRPPAGDLGPWVNVEGTNAGGYLDAAHALVADLSLDGNPEAVVPLSPGAGLPGVGAVVFTPTEDAPALVGDAAFYGSLGPDTRVSIEGGELVVRQSVAAGWEPACCPSGELTRRFRSDGTTLIESAAPLEVGNLEARGFTIDRFYALVGQRNLDAAYAMLTESERARTAASQWPAWWALGSQITVNIMDTPRTDELVPFRLIIATLDGRILAWQGGAALQYHAPSNSWQIQLLSLQPEQA
jgi:hypothetical protein